MNLFSPGIYEHAASLIGERPGPVSQNAELLFLAQSTAWQRYRHPLLVAGMDVYNVECEALGAVLDTPDGDGVPCVVTHPLTTVDEVLTLEAPDPARAGRMPLVLGVARRLVEACEGATVFVPLCGPLAFANGLLGMDEILCTMMDEPALVGAALSHLSGIQARYVQAILAVGARPLIFESGASPPLLSPALFSQIEAPALGRLFSSCRDAGDSSPFCILGGDVLPVLPELIALEPGFLICPSETDQAGFVKAAAAHPQVAVRVNMPVASLLESDWEKTALAADHAIGLARRLQRSSVGTGVVPFQTDPNLLLRLREYVQQAHAKIS